MQNQRRNSRLRYRSHGTITDGKTKWPAHIVNLSPHGALVAVICEHRLKEAENISLKIELLDDTSLLMHGTVVHIQEHYIGLACEPKSKTGKERLASVLYSTEEIEEEKCNPPALDQDS